MKTKTANVTHSAEVTTLTLPIIHLGGTSARTLTDDYCHALRAILDARTVLSNVEFNARDYDCSPNPGAWLEARQQHHARLMSLDVIAAELEVIAQHTSEFVRA